MQRLKVIHLIILLNFCFQLFASFCFAQSQSGHKSAVQPVDLFHFQFKEIFGRIQCHENQENCKIILKPGSIDQRSLDLRSASHKKPFKLNNLNHQDVVIQSFYYGRSLDEVSEIFVMTVQLDRAGVIQ